MRTVYATQFTIQATADNDIAHVWQTAQQRIGEWVKSFYQSKDLCLTFPFIGGTVEPADGHQLLVESPGLPDPSRFWAVEWTHPDDRDNTLRWRIYITVATTGEELEFSILIRVASRSFTVVPARFTLRRPGIVRKLIHELSCHIGGRPVSGSPIHLGVDDVDEFVASTLTSPQRPLPAVVVSRELMSEQPSIGIDGVNRLADNVAGLAEVYLVADKWTAFRLTDQVGKERSCFDGAVRLFWPGFSVYAQPRQHPLYLGNYIRWHEDNGRPFQDFLLRMLAAVASFRHTDGPVTREARASVKAQRQKHIDDLRHQLAERGEKDDDLLQEVFDENERLTKERDSALVRQLELEDDLRAAKENLETIYQYQSQQDQDGEPAPTAIALIEFGSVVEAVEQAETDFDGNLVILETAIGSARKSPFTRPDRVYQALQAIDEVAVEWKRAFASGKATGESWVGAFKRRGFDYKDSISKTSKGKYGDEYYFLYDGQNRLFDKHITEGAKQANKCFSIHMYRDDEKRVVVIAHVGRHLRNTRS